MAVRWATDFVPAGTSACVDPQKVRRLGRGCHRLSNLGPIWSQDGARFVAYALRKLLKARLCNL